MIRPPGLRPPAAPALRATARDAEVIVVGGGPAGAAAAITLARGGVDVLLLDRSAFPRAKACGDCLSPGATPVLARLGALRAVLAADPATLTGWRLRSPGGARLEMPFPAGVRALALDRAALDATLLERARRAGARVRTGARVTDLIGTAERGIAGVRARADDGSGMAIRARFIVGADGLRSTVAARLGASRPPPRLRKLSFTSHVSVALPWRPSAFGELRLGRGLCLGMAPVRLEGERGAPWNITMVFHAARWGRPDRAARREYVRAAVEELAGEGVCFDWSGAPEPLASGSFDRPVNAVSGPGWALVGDAAGYYDPFTGQGIYQALAGGEALGALLVDALGGRAAVDPPRVPGWAAHHARLTRGPRRLQRLIEAVVSRPALCDFAFDRLAASRSLTAALGAVTGDLDPTCSLARPALLLETLRGLCARA